jgi:transketolase
MAFLGNSHYGIEDVAIMRAIPNISVVCPADCAEIFKVVEAAANFQGPMYIRLTGAVNNPPVYMEDYSFQIGKAITLMKPSQVTFIASGSMVYESLEAAKILEHIGIKAGVINMHTIKPLDTDAVQSAINNSELIVTVEEHSIIGGLGSAVAEFKASRYRSPPLLIIGLPDAFDLAGDYRFLLEHHGLISSKIADRVKAFLKLK